MRQALPTRRRWFQFGLGTMFLVVTLFAVWLAYEANWMRQRQAFIAAQESSANDRSVPVSYEHTDSNTRAPGLLWVLGERGWYGVAVITAAPSQAELTLRDYVRLRTAKGLFPEANIMAVHHTRYPDGTTRTSLSAPDVDAVTQP